jgi:hypothetical protein
MSERSREARAEEPPCDAPNTGYDDRQLGAALKACATCGKWWYFVNHAQTICLWCRSW